MVENELFWQNCNWIAMSCVVYMVNCNFATHVTCPLTFKCINTMSCKCPLQFKNWVARLIEKHPFSHGVYQV